MAYTNPFNTTTMRIKTILLALTCLCTASVMQAQNKEEQELRNEKNIEFATAMNDFAFELYRLIKPDAGKNDNFVYSPMSVYLMLGILANGADGVTLNEINKLTGIPLDTLNTYCERLMRTYNDMKSPCMETASYLAVNKKISLLEKYKMLTAQHFLAEAESMDFNKKESLHKINGWCKKITHGLIPSIIQELTPDMLAVLMNAVYFKGEWVSAFDKSDTKDRDFTCEDGTMKKIKQMFQGDTKEKFQYAENDTFQVLRMPYKGQNNFHMTIVLPTKGHTTSELMQKMTADRWKSIKQKMRWEIVYITMPVFSFENRIGLKDPMKKMGLVSGFSNGANFSNMSATPLKIDDMFQKARIEVNETGTEAAAVTAAVMVLGAAVNAPRPKIYRFTADHPFIYTIEDGKNGNIIFMGEYRGK